MSAHYDALLEVREFAVAKTGLPRWFWRLSDRAGGLVAESAVDLARDEDAVRARRFRAFLTDPHAFMQHGRFGEPGEERMGRDLGDWLRRTVLTKRIWDGLTAHGPATVLLRLDPNGPEREVIGYPLVLAADGGGSLADRLVTFVHDIDPRRPAAPPDPARETRPLHVVGFFGRTATGEPLDLHAEQSQVLGTIENAAADGRGMDITRRALSYHVTKEQVGEHLGNARRGDNRQEADWAMILHLAGRGTPGTWSVGEGAHEHIPVTAQDLCGKLRGSGNDRRLRLVVMTTRPASSPSLADRLAMFRIPSHTEPEPGVTDSCSAVGGLAVDLAVQLGCPVLAFRHRISDQGAVALMVSLYDQLLTRGLSLPRALAAAIEECRDVLSPLDVAAPVLYGAQACGLTLNPPQPPRADELTYRSAPSLVGHHEPMWSASRVLARLAGDGHNGVVLHGMPGVGKTTCADELISLYQHRYRDVLRHVLGSPGDEPPDEVLRRFLRELLQLPAMRPYLDADGVTVEERLDEVMADDLEFERMSRAVEQRITGNTKEYALVALLDVGELTVARPQDARAVDDGPWRDPRWARLISAMTLPDAPGFRLLVTSPRPLRLDRDRLLDVPMPLPAPAEAFLHAQGLPSLGPLIDAAARDTADDEDRKLIHDVLSRAAGHPGLLRFADTVAGERDGRARLRRLADLDMDPRAWRGKEAEQPPSAWTGIEEWAHETMGCIPEEDPRHLLLLVLSRLRPRDLVLSFVDGGEPGLPAVVWAGLRRRRLGLPPEERTGEEDDGGGLHGETRELDDLVTALARDGLVSRTRRPGSSEVRIRIHPAVALAVDPRRRIGTEDGDVLRSEVDRIACRHTAGLAKRALRRRTHGGTADVLRLISSALPYLERVEDWSTYLLLVAALMTRSRRDRGLSDMVRRLERITGSIPQDDPDPGLSTMAQRLYGVFEDLKRGDRRPGLSALLGTGQGDPDVDGSPLAVAMSVVILSGLRDTGRLAVAERVGGDYLDRLVPGARVGLVASAVEVEVLRVLLDAGRLPEVLDRFPAAAEALADARFRGSVDTHWADGEILRQKLFTIRRDTHVQLAAEASGAAEGVHRDRARADHVLLGRCFVPDGEGTAGAVKRHLHLVEGCLLELEPRLHGDRNELTKLDNDLVAHVHDVELSGDIVLVAMTDSARARVQRAHAGLARAEGNGEAEGTAMKEACYYELNALRLFYAQGTPMDVGACHRRIGDDQLRCEEDRVRRDASAHHMYSALLGELTDAHVLRGREEDRERWRRDPSAPGGVDELCDRLRGAFRSPQDPADVPIEIDPKKFLLRMVDDEQDLASGFRRLLGDS
ncbi:hypothetical protein CW362_28660 [Streptomyces populi]|uniref:Uncharacterized protein n=1 Tax=Streptomyces populi TaxID=2058924 RepID=A0A2I0SI46_9ACTN|nr:hypothetical protein [Streptomyces populi]PKT69588.1 hypothetical protein CW362_28660 [Streptomyces populi]